MYCIYVAKKNNSEQIKCRSYGEPLENGDKTGVCLQEAADPYYVYLDSGADVDIVSIKGGQIPYDTKPKTKNVRRFLDDESAMSKLNNSSKIDDVNFDDYDLVFMAGGWGAAFDLPVSDILGAKVSRALQMGKPMIASTCHGALGFVRANRTDGTPYIKGTSYLNERCSSTNTLICTHTITSTHFRCQNDWCD